MTARRFVELQFESLSDHVAEMETDVLHAVDDLTRERDEEPQKHLHTQELLMAALTGALTERNLLLGQKQLAEAERDSLKSLLEARQGNAS